MTPHHLNSATLRNALGHENWWPGERTDGWTSQAQGSLVALARTIEARVLLACLLLDWFTSLLDQS